MEKSELPPGQDMSKGSGSSAGTPGGLYGVDPRAPGAGIACEDAVGKLEVQPSKEEGSSLEIDLLEMTCEDKNESTKDRCSGCKELGDHQNLSSRTAGSEVTEILSV